MAFSLFIVDGDFELSFNIQLLTGFANLTMSWIGMASHTRYINNLPYRYQTVIILRWYKHRLWCKVKGNSKPIDHYLIKQFGISRLECPALTLSSDYFQGLTSKNRVVIRSKFDTWDILRQINWESFVLNHTIPDEICKQIKFAFRVS